MSPLWHGEPAWSARSRRWRRRDTSSQAWYRDVVGSLRPVHGLEPALDRTGEQELDQPFVSMSCQPLQPVLARVDPFHLEPLPGFDLVLLPELSGQDDLTFAGHSRHHGL